VGENRRKGKEKGEIAEGEVRGGEEGAEGEGGGGGTEYGGRWGEVVIGKSGPGGLYPLRKVLEGRGWSRSRGGNSGSLEVRERRGRGGKKKGWDGKYEIGIGGWGRGYMS